MNVNSWIFWAVIGAIILLIAFYTLGKKSKYSGDHAIISIDDEINLPDNWNPTPDAEGLHAAMEGLGTDEDLIWQILGTKNKAQLAAIYNEFNSLFFNDYEMNLFGWFEDDLSKEDYKRAMAYFSGIEFEN